MVDFSRPSCGLTSRRSSTPRARSTRGMDCARSSATRLCGGRCCCCCCGCCGFFWRRCLCWFFCVGCARRALGWFVWRLFLLWLLLLCRLLLLWLVLRFFGILLLLLRLGAPALLPRPRIVDD